MVANLVCQLSYVPPEVSNDSSNTFTRNSLLYLLLFPFFAFGLTHGFKFLRPKGL